MSTSLTITGQMRLAASWVDDLTRTTVTDSATVNRLLSLANGTGAGQANGYWRDVRPAGANATDTIDTTALPLSVFGTAGTLNLASVKLIYVRNLSTNAGTLNYDINGTNYGIPPGGSFLWTAGTAATDKWFHGNNIVIKGNSSGMPSYEIILAGVKAT